MELQVGDEWPPSGAATSITSRSAIQVSSAHGRVPDLIDVNEKLFIMHHDANTTPELMPRVVHRSLPKDLEYQTR